MTKLSNFKENYSRISKHHRNIKKLEEQEIEAVTYYELHYAMPLHSDSFFIMTTTMLFFFATAPLLLSLFWSLSGNLSVLVNDALNSHRILRDTPALWVSVILTVSTALVYTLVTPFTGLLKPTINLPPKNFTFWLFVVIVNYAAFWISLVAIHSVISEGIKAFHIAVHITVFLPFIAISLLPSFLLMYIAIYFDRYNILSTFSSRSLLMAKLAALIIKIEQLPNGHEVDKEKRREICSHIREIGNMIAILPAIDKKTIGMVENALKKMGDPANAFKSLQGHILIPEQDYKRILTAKLIRYFNLIACGNYAGLPVIQHELMRSFQLNTPPGAVKRVMIGVTLILYLLLPIALYMIFMNYYSIILDNDVRLSMRLIYVVYVIGGISLFLEKMTGNTKDLFLELAKRIISGKG